MFNLRPDKEISHASYLYHPEYLPLEHLSLNNDSAFSTTSAVNADIGYRAWNKGSLGWVNKCTAEKIESLPAPSLKDEYSFLFKYWGKPWATFALLQRLISFRNPAKEVAAFSKASKVKKINPSAEPIIRQDYQKFRSDLIEESPLIAVIIPTLNRYEYLKDVLEDLEKQDYENFEVIVVDQSDPFKKEFYDQFDLRLTVIHQTEKMLWTARNNAVRATEAQYLLFFDDDSRVDPDWIKQHLKCLDYFKCDISAGVSYAKVGMKTPANYSYFRWADQFDSGNALVKREIFKKIGLFDEQFNKQRMGDGEFGIRAYLNGFKSISNPLAYRVHLKVSEGGLREIGSWDGFRPKKWFAPKPVPSVVFLYKKYFPKNLYRRTIALGLILSNVSYRNKGSRKMLAWSVLSSLVLSPVLLIQFLRARSIANRMLQRDDGIKLLES